MRYYNLKITQIILLGLILLIFSGCGYKVAGFNSPNTFYIDDVTNKTMDTQYGDEVQHALDSYFVVYGEMSNYEKAKYVLDVTLNKITLQDNIVSSTKESVNSNIILDLTLVVTDKSGKEIYSYNANPSVSYNISQSISETIQNRDAAIKEAMTDALDLFRDSFNSAFL